MRTTEYQESVKGSQFVPLVVWVGLIMPLGVFAVLALFIGEPSEHHQDKQAALIVNVLAGVAALGSLAVPRFIPSGSSLRKILQEPTDPEQMGTTELGVNESAVKRFKAMTEEERRVYRALGEMFVPYLLSLALAEAVGAMGLVLAFIGYPSETYLPLFAGAFLCMLLRFPRPAHQEAQVWELVRTLPPSSGGVS